jgi:hypothetical protein
MLAGYVQGTLYGIRGFGWGICGKWPSTLFGGPEQLKTADEISPPVAFPLGFVAPLVRVISPADGFSQIRANGI